MKTLALAVAVTLLTQASFAQDTNSDKIRLNIARAKLGILTHKKQKTRDNTVDRAFLDRAAVAVERSEKLITTPDICFGSQCKADEKQHFGDVQIESAYMMFASLPDVTHKKSNGYDVFHLIISSGSKGILDVAYAYKGETLWVMRIDQLPSDWQILLPKGDSSHVAILTPSGMFVLLRDDPMAARFVASDDPGLVADP